MDNLPFFLQNAYECAQKYPPKKDRYLQLKWEKFVAQISEEYPFIDYQPDLELLFTGAISPGCRICRSGKWDCFFITPLCNLNCSFCYSPNQHKINFTGSNLGEDFMKNLNSYSQLDIRGVSFTGGEALLEKEHLISYVSKLGKLVDHIWLYSNGLLLSDGILNALVEAGLDELRINAAATGYQHPSILKLMEKASELLQWVTVEIPLIPGDEDILLSSLAVWEKHGVNTVNLHEFIYEPGSNAEQFPGQKQNITLPDGHKTAIDPTSDQLAVSAFRTAKVDKLNLGINYCSTSGKWRQIIARREALLPVSREDYESYLGEGVLESYFTILNNQAQAIPQDKLEQFIQKPSKTPIFRLTRMAPLSLQEKQKNWKSFELIS